jgi:hypothetical protein
VAAPHPRPGLQRAVQDSATEDVGTRLNAGKRRGPTVGVPVRIGVVGSPSMKIGRWVAVRSEVAGLDAPMAADLGLQRRALVMHHRSRRRDPKNEDQAPGNRPGWRPTERRHGRNGRREVDLGQRLERPRERAVLEAVAVARQRVTKQALRRANALVRPVRGAFVERAKAGRLRDPVGGCRIVAGAARVSAAHSSR